MNLFGSFLHNVVVHPLFFVGELFARVGLDVPMAIVEALHEATAPIDVDAPRTAPEAAAVDETEGWPVPAQSPRTDASRALEWYPAARPAMPPPPPPLAGSRAARMRGARETG